MTEQDISRINESLRLLIDTSTRTEERVVSLVGQYKDHTEKLEHVLQVIGSHAVRITVLENQDTKSLRDLMDKTRSDLNTLQKDLDISKILQGQDRSKWTAVISGLGQIALAIATGYLVLKFGLK